MNNESSNADKPRIQMYRGLPALLFSIFIEYRTSNVERRMEGRSGRTRVGLRPVVVLYNAIYNALL